MLPSMTCPKLMEQLRKGEVGSTSCNGDYNATKTLQDKLISGYVTLCNILCNLCCNGAMKLQDKSQDKLSSVTVPFGPTFYKEGRGEGWDS